MRGDPAVGQAARRGLGHASPLRVAQMAIGQVDLPQIGFQLAHPVEARRLAGIGANAFDGCRIELRADVVEHEFLEAAGERAGACAQRDCAAHRRADPVEFLPAERVDKGGRELAVEVEAIFGLRRGAPLRQATTDRVRRDDVPVLAKRFRQIVEIAAGAREPVPQHELAFCRIAPFHIVQFAIEDRDVFRDRAAHDFGSARNFPTMPVGKK